MAKRHLRSLSSYNLKRIQPMVRLWLLRLLIPLGCHRDFLSMTCCYHDALAEALGLGKWVASDDCTFDHQAMLAELRKCHETAERRNHNSKAPIVLRRNIARLANLVGLSDVDCRILEFVIMIYNESLLDDVAYWLGDISAIKVSHVLSVVLDIPERKIRASLGIKGILSRSGLVSVDRSVENTLRRKLDVLSEDFVYQSFSSDADPVSLLREMVFISVPPHLTIDDYVHIDSTLKIITPYLRQSITLKRKGVNIFLYGVPGSGKTQLVRVLAKELECDLFDVANEDDDGFPVDGARRLRAFRAAQSFFSGHNSLILFDEVEDVFNNGNELWGYNSTAQTHKAWINRTLEENAVPTLWLSNSATGIDPAFIRRFDMVIELPLPPQKQRERIVHKECSDFLDAQTVSRVASLESLAPAVVTRAAKVVRSIQQDLGNDGTISAFELLVNNTLETQGHKSLRRNDQNRLPETYDARLISTDTDLSQLTKALSNGKSGRFCLYGPPGTGKTAYAHWLAEQIQVPLRVKKASDLISKYLGETEQRIANAFREAESEGAVLLMDEVDSFLQDRRSAQRTWEITEVNEMLTQMESFSGVFIASTNLMDSIDQAALRRFDLKVKFGFLKADQAWELLQRHCAALKLPKPTRKIKSVISRLLNLTPGDFATVARQHTFKPITSAANLVSALEAECAVKEGVKRSIGFI